MLENDVREICTLTLERSRIDWDARAETRARNLWARRRVEGPPAAGRKPELREQLRQELERKSWFGYVTALGPRELACVWLLLALLKGDKSLRLGGLRVPTAELKVGVAASDVVERETEHFKKLIARAAKKPIGHGGSRGVPVVRHHSFAKGRPTRRGAGQR